MLKVCLTGATGFIGENLLKKLEDDPEIEVIALSRKISPQMDGAKKKNIIWKRCNGFSLLDIEQATKDVDILIYLIHSMAPTSTLSEGSFADFDLLLADNFSRAAKTNKIKKIIYLSGLIPNEKNLSEHLRSRLEVEKTLAQYSNSVTTLRAGLIIGKNGSSFKILERLIKRLPLLICPKWTLKKSQPIDIEDVLNSLNYVIKNYQQLKRSSYDIAGPNIITYQQMLKLTAKILQQKRYFLNVPLFSPRFSKLWVAKVSGTSYKLVSPLIDSLKHNMIACPQTQLILPNYTYKGFENSLRSGITKESGSWMRILINYNSVINLHWMETATFIARFRTKNMITAQSLGDHYFSWLERTLFFLNIHKKDKKNFSLVFCGIKILQLKKNQERTTRDRSVYYITGGVLAAKKTFNGRIEFRYIEQNQVFLISLIDFKPSLPWFIYKYTQAVIHKLIMNKFKKYLLKTPLV